MTARDEKNTTPVRRLRPQLLEESAFRPFGDVIAGVDIAKRAVINYGATERWADLAALDVMAEGGRPIVSLFRTKPLARPLVIRVMERHPLSSQTFMPLGPHPYLIVVAPAGPFEAARLKAFLASPGQGVNYARGVWHHYSLALGAVSDFLVLDREGAGNNLDEVALARTDQVMIDLPDSGLEGA